MKTDRKYILGFVGCGHMGMAIARGAVAKEYLERRDICIYDPNEEVQKKCLNEGFTVMKDAAAVAKDSHITMLAVRPQQCDEALASLEGADLTTLLSIVTGVSIDYLQSKLNNVPVIRAMPNTPLQISEGATALCMSSNCKADEYDFVFRLFRHMGVTRTVPEEQLNAFVSVHGSTPAYFYYLAECILNDLVERGIDEETARALLVQTLVGSGKLLQKNASKPISEFIDEVCSKGGTTIQAVQSMREDGLQEIIHKANEKCIRRAEELGR